MGLLFVFVLEPLIHAEGLERSLERGLLLGVATYTYYSMRTVLKTMRTLLRNTSMA